MGSASSVFGSQHKFLDSGLKPRREGELPDANEQSLKRLGNRTARVAGSGATLCHPLLGTTAACPPPFRSVPAFLMAIPNVSSLPTPTRPQQPAADCAAQGNPMPPRPPHPCFHQSLPAGQRSVLGNFLSKKRNLVAECLWLTSCVQWNISGTPPGIGICVSIHLSSRSLTCPPPLCVNGIFRSGNIAVSWTKDGGWLSPNPLIAPCPREYWDKVGTGSH